MTTTLCCLQFNCDTKLNLNVADVSAHKGDMGVALGCNATHFDGAGKHLFQE